MTMFLKRQRFVVGVYICLEGHTLGDETTTLIAACDSLATADAIARLLRTPGYDVHPWTLTEEQARQTVKTLFRHALPNQGIHAITVERKRHAPLPIEAYTIAILAGRETTEIVVNGLEDYSRRAIAFLLSESTLEKSVRKIFDEN